MPTGFFSCPERKDYQINLIESTSNEIKNEQKDLQILKSFENIEIF